MKVSIVIPIYNNWALTHQCLFDIYSKCTLVDEVVVVNDCSPEEAVYQGMEWWKNTKMLPLRHIKLSENVMFLKASNIGMKKATGDVIILLSNDVRLNGNIVTPILEILKDNDRTLIGGRYLDWNTGWNHFDGTTFPYLEGWLLAATKAGWEELGYFDERYAPSDYEDIDLSTTARVGGYKLDHLPEGITKHIGAQSIPYGSAREQITIRNKEKFKQKWIK
jgi:GT2 family glycosyltransferase